MDRRALTPADVHEVIFDKAPLGKRGYHETQVDDFLDRIEATLAGTDALTVEDVRTVVFEHAPLIKRGYHETQVDNFLDIVVGEFEQRARNGSGAAERSGAATAAPSEAVAMPRPALSEQTSPMLFAQPPSLSADRPGKTVARDEPAPATQPLKPPQPTRETQPTDSAEPAASGEAVPAAHIRPPAEVLTLPLPPAPPGTRGYRPGDVQRLANLLASALTGAADQDEVDTPTATDIANAKLSRTFFIGQGYRTEVVDALHAAWVEELRHRES